MYMYTMHYTNWHLGHNTTHLCAAVELNRYTTLIMALSADVVLHVYMHNYSASDRHYQNHDHVHVHDIVLVLYMYTAVENITTQLIKAAW